jgi:hypothetical protein
VRAMDNKASTARPGAFMKAKAYQTRRAGGNQSFFSVSGGVFLFHSRPSPSWVTAISMNSSPISLSWS